MPTVEQVQALQREVEDLKQKLARLEGQMANVEDLASLKKNHGSLLAEQERLKKRFQELLASYQVEHGKLGGR